MSAKHPLQQMQLAKEPDAAMPAGISTPWYVAHTKPRQEQAARENLVRQGYGVYLPQLKVLKNAGRAQRVGFEPMFPRYLFFQPSSVEQSIAPVRSTHGVTSIVRFGGIPALLPADTLRSILAFECRQNAADISELRDLRPGKAVVITTGPLAGLQGLVSMVSKQRVIVLMRLLGEETRVRVSPRELKLAA